MSYLTLAYTHLATVIPAFFIGSYLMLNRKGTANHKALGKVYMALMLLTAFITLFMSAEVGPAFLGHFGYIHLFSAMVLFCIPMAYKGARSGNMRQHRGNMIGVYVGGLLIAGSFALMPGRLLHGWLFS